MWMCEERWDFELCVARLAAHAKAEEIPENPYRAAESAAPGAGAEKLEKKRFWDRMFFGLFGTTDPFQGTPHGRQSV